MDTAMQLQDETRKSKMASLDRRSNNLGYWNYEAGRQHPSKIALIDLSGTSPRELRYAELEARLNRAASLFLRLGLQPGDRLAMALSNRLEFIEIMYGAMRAGIVPVPLNTKLSPDTLEYIIRDASCAGAIVEPAANAHIADIVDISGVKLRLSIDAGRDGWRDYENELVASSAHFDPPELTDDHLAFLPYTSGSTGRPKGVALTHAGQCWWVRCLHKYWPLSPDSRSLTAVPLYHKNAMAGAIKPALSQGGSVVILPNFEPRRFLEALSSYRCTKAGGVPAVYTLLLQQRDLIKTLDFSALQLLTIGSAPTPKELQDAVRSAFGVPVRETYGLTEGGPVMMGVPLDGRSVPQGSCGVAWPEGEVKLVDGDGREHSSYGELWVKNPGMTPGYYNLPDVNRESLRDGWLRTGDVFFGTQKASSTSGDVRTTCSAPAARMSIRLKSKTSCSSTRASPRSRSFRCHIK